jgi:hypothetical protein
MKRIVLAACIALSVSVANAGDVWIDLNATSFHFSEGKYNQKNIGVGFEYHLPNDDFLILAGRYRNSVNMKSTYLLGGWTPVEFKAGPVRFKMGAVAGAINGYPELNNGGIGAIGAGLVRAEYKDVGVNLFMLPSAKKSPLTVGVQFKVKF